MREKTLKMSERHYQLLSDMVKGHRQRAQVVEGLIETLANAFEKDKYLLYDVMTDPSILTIKRNKG